MNAKQDSTEAIATDDSNDMPERFLVYLQLGIGNSQTSSTMVRIYQVARNYTVSRHEPTVMWLPAPYQGGAAIREISAKEERWERT